MFIPIRETVSVKPLMKRTLFLYFLLYITSGCEARNKIFHDPLLVEFLQPSVASHTRSVVHDVPVGIIPSRFWDDYAKPDLPVYDVRHLIPAVFNSKPKRLVFSNLLTPSKGSKKFTYLGLE